MRLRLALLLCLMVAPASAESVKRASKGPSVVFVWSPAQAERLRSSSEAEVRAALDEARLGGPAAATAVSSIVALLERGTTTALAEAALDTLGDIESPFASGVLAMYTHHRMLPLRRAAVRGLSRTRGPEATPALRRALSDRDPEVRGLAATGLGALGARAAFRDLLVALDRGVNEAASSIGMICDGDECRELTKRLGKLPFDVVTSGFEPVWSRPQVAEDLKLQMVSALRELATFEAHAFMKSVLDRFPRGGSAKLKQALVEAARETAGGSR